MDIKDLQISILLKINKHFEELNSENSYFQWYFLTDVINVFPIF